MKKLKKIVPFLIILLVVFATYLIANTYAKYKTSVDGNAEMAVARWRFKINNEDINYGSTESIELTPNFDENPNIKEGVIAPTSSGFFDIVIDYTDVDVAFNYKLVVNSNTNVTDFTIKGYELNSSGTMISLNNGEEISNNVMLNSGATTVDIRVFIEWNDNPDTESMNNRADTMASISGDNAVLSVALDFKQLA